MIAFLFIKYFIHSIKISLDKRLETIILKLEIKK